LEKRAMEEVWKIHTDAEFLTHDVEATLATMTEDAFVINVPTDMGGHGKSEVRAFYWDSFVNSLPDDATNQLTNRVIGDSALVDELRHYTHPMKEDVKKKDFSPPLGEMRVW
jgi:carboxymethylenebutenolidase